jgi:RNA polymerase-binding transcription factor DksA
MVPSATSATHGSTTLSDEQLMTLREMLEEQRAFRLDQLEQLRRDEATATNGDREIHESLVTGARAALREVIEALARMEDGRYGTCRQCSQPLPVARLEVLPQLALCMECQRALEA